MRYTLKLANDYYRSGRRIAACGETVGTLELESGLSPAELFEALRMGRLHVDAYVTNEVTQDERDQQT